MNHDLVRLLGELAFFGIVLLLPALYLIYSDRFSQLPGPNEFSVMLGVVVVCGILLGLPALAICASAVLFGIGLARLSARSSLAFLSYQRELSPTRLFPGDDGELAIRIENRKLLPLSWLRVEDPIDFKRVRQDHRLDDALGFSGGLDRKHEAIVSTAAMGPYQSLTRRYTVTALKRGVYTLGPARVRSGDLFGLFTEEGQIAGPLELIVYPRIFPVQDVELPFRELQGEVVPRHALLEDPTLLAGSREYRPGDPLRRVHWKATAHTGALRVRTSDPSTTANMFIVVNLNTHQYLWSGVDVERMEAAIDAAASVAAWGIEKGYAVGIRANGLTLGAERAARIGPSAHPRQMTNVLEYLARLSYSSRFSAEEILLDEGRRLATRSAIVLVTPILTPELSSVLRSAPVSGRVSVVYCGGFAAPVLRGVPMSVLVPPVSRRAAS